MFTERLREGLERLQLDQRQLAVKIGRHETTVGKWLKGTLQPNLDDLARLSKILGASVGWLLGAETATAAPPAATPVPAPDDDAFLVELLEGMEALVERLHDRRRGRATARKRRSG